jgi:hypothetical protein
MISSFRFDYARFSELIFFSTPPFWLHFQFLIFYFEIHAIFISCSLFRTEGARLRELAQGLNLISISYKVSEKNPLQGLDDRLKSLKIS